VGELGELRVSAARHTRDARVTPNGRDALLAALAKRQHGNVTRPRLLALGFDDHEILYRVKLGRLSRLFAGVYAVGPAPTTPLARAAAAVLACGQGALVSHDSACSPRGGATTGRRRSMSPRAATTSATASASTAPPA